MVTEKVQMTRCIEKYTKITGDVYKHLHASGKKKLQKITGILIMSCPGPEDFPNDFPAGQVQLRAGHFLCSHA